MILAVDTETTGFNPFKGDRPFAISTCDEAYKTDYVTIGLNDLVPISGLLLSRELTSVYHNAKFDILMLNRLGMPVNGTVHDTMIMSHVYNPDESSKALKSLAEKYLNEKPSDEQEVKAYIRKHKCGYDKVPRKIMEPYARNDARITMLLFEFYKNKGVLEDPTYKKEMNLLHCLIRMQTRGALIDTIFCQENSNACLNKINEIEKDVENEYGEMNIYSSKQLGEFLFDREKIQCTHYTAKGNPCLDEYNLKQYEHPIIPKVIEARELKKLKSTYFDALKEECDADNQIHCDFFQVGAKTGRFSCLAGWSLIRTKRGDVPIKDVVVGDYVWTHKKRWRKVLASWMNGIEQVYDVILSNGNVLTCTNDHRVLSYDKRWITIQRSRTNTLLTGERGQLVKITHIIPKEAVEVYDVTVEEDESYTADGVFVHNCRQPNLQNIPRDGVYNVRRAFICRPNYTNYYFDYSQIELRIFAHYSKEPQMIAELLKEEGDLHAMTARKLFHVETPTKEQRDIAKRLNFGIIYGIGANRFAATLNQAYPDKNFTHTQAKAFISRYYRAYPQISYFVGAVKRKILEVGFVKDVFGRKYTCPKDQCYKAVNYLIQGCAAGVLKHAMIELDKLLLKKESNILLTIHDELVVEIHKDEENLPHQIVDLMEDHKTFRVPITVNVEKTNTNWYEKEPIEGIK